MPDFGGTPRLAARGDTVHPMAKTLLLALFPCALLAADASRAVGARLSVKLDRPVLTNVTGLVDGDTVSSQHPLFGGTMIVTARFTGEGPQIFVIRAKSFSAEPAG